MIIKFSELPKIRRKYGKDKIVFAGGTFDIFHKGHIEAIKNLKKYGDIVIIAVSTNKRVRERKGPLRPILSQKERLALVDAVRYVDFCLLAPESKKGLPVPTMRILEKLKPDDFVSIENNWLKYKKDVECLGIRLHILKRGWRSSTTAVIEKILEKYDNSFRH